MSNWSHETSPIDSIKSLFYLLGSTAAELYKKKTITTTRARAQ